MWRVGRAGTNPVVGGRDGPNPEALRISACNNNDHGASTNIVALAGHLLVTQTSASAVGNSNRVELEAKDEAQVQVVDGDIDKVANLTKAAQGSLKIFVHQAEVVQSEVNLETAHGRISANVNAKLAFELVDGGSVLRLGDSEGIVVDISTDETVALHDLLAGDSILQVVEAKVDAAAVDGDASIEELYLSAN